MNYNFQDSPYGMRPISEKNSMQGLAKSTCNDRMPISAMEDSCMPNYQSGCEPCVPNYECSSEEENKHCIPTPSYNQCSCSGNNSNGCDNQDDDDFINSCNTCPKPQSNCCNGDPCVYDKCKETCFCSYMNVIYSEGISAATSVFNTVTLSATNYSVIPTYNQGGACCASCGVDSTSTFTIDSVRTTIKGFLLSSDIPTTSIVVNGANPLQIDKIGSTYEAILDSSVLNKLCACKEYGSKANILMAGLGPWSYVAEYELCGTVITQGTSCKFHIIAENLNAVPDIINTPINLMVPEVCMPHVHSNPINMTIEFDADGALVNPTIKAIGGPSPLPTTLTIGGTMMLSIGAGVSVSQRKKVCLTGVVEDSRNIIKK